MDLVAGLSYDSCHLFTVPSLLSSCQCLRGLTCCLVRTGTGAPCLSLSETLEGFGRGPVGTGTQSCRCRRQSG